MRFDDIVNLRLPGLLQPVEMDPKQFGPDQVTCLKVLQVTGKRFTQSSKGRVTHGSVENVDPSMCSHTALAASHVYAWVILEDDPTKFSRVYKDPTEFNKLFLFGAQFTYRAFVVMMTRALRGAMYSCLPSL
jgi:hypothetical protein